MSKNWENIQHSTFNLEHRMGYRALSHSALNVECWASNVLTILEACRG
jgi:hypothetical protein